MRHPMVATETCGCGASITFSAPRLTGDVAEVMTAWRAEHRHPSDDETVDLYRRLTDLNTKRIVELEAQVRGRSPLDQPPIGWEPSHDRDQGE